MLAGTFFHTGLGLGLGFLEENLDSDLDLDLDLRIVDLDLHLGLAVAGLVTSDKSAIDRYRKSKVADLSRGETGKSAKRGSRGLPVSCRGDVTGLSRTSRGSRRNGIWALDSA